MCLSPAPYFEQISCEEGLALANQAVAEKSNDPRSSDDRPEKLFMIFGREEKE
jgi:hypothetical protein